MNVLNWPHWKIVDYAETDTEVTITAELIDPPVVCVHCGCIGNLGRYGVRQHSYFDQPIRAKPTRIVVNRRRYRCEDCGRTFFEPLDDMDTERRMTTRLIAYVKTTALRQTFVHVATETGISEASVRNIFADYVRHLDATTRFATPEYMGLDELHIVRRARGVIVNAKERTVVEVLPDRNKATIARYVAGLPDKQRVMLVAMDMWRPYRDVVNELLPGAQVVVDKFHVVRMASSALDDVRKSIRASLTDRQRRTLMHDRFTLLKRRKDLSERERLILAAWTQQFPQLGTAYTLKEGFYEIFDTYDRGEAIALYDEWHRKLPQDLQSPFSELTRAMTNWNEEIFAYFDSALTNASTEAMNGLGKVIVRMGRGYSFEVLRAKLLYTPAVQKKSKPKRAAAWVVPPDAMGRIRTPYEEPEINFGADISTLIERIESDSL
jgi:transposase